MEQEIEQFQSEMDSKIEKKERQLQKLQLDIERLRERRNSPRTELKRRQRYKRHRAKKVEVKKPETTEKKSFLDELFGGDE